jgi:hypothetical protein
LLAGQTPAISLRSVLGSHGFEYGKDYNLINVRAVPESEPNKGGQHHSRRAMKLIDRERAAVVAP